MKISDKLLDWMNSGKTGASSKCMAFHLTGRDSDGSYPHDAADFGRCVGLLNAVPELRALLPQMATLNPYWAALVKKWQEIETIEGYEAQSAAIGKIIRPIEDKDKNVIRLSGGCSIRFGKV